MPKNLFGVYVHWPFCKSKCPYCDFNSHVSDSVDHDRWLQAYLQEIDYIAEKTKGRQVTSIFFGGGTPSLMKPETVAGVIDHIQKRWNISNDVEITLEANPTSIEVQKFKDFKLVGVNRVSIGVQSLRDDDLKFLGREHSANEAIKAVQTAAKIFDRYSFDLIYARPEQPVDAWKEELIEALNYTNGHLSLYQLTIEKGTPFYTQEKRGDFRIPEGDQAGEFYEVTQEILDKVNMPAYEISNHAIEGQESQHNLAYWRYADYVGVGPGAHGRLTLKGPHARKREEATSSHESFYKYATRTHRAPDIWLDKVAEKGHGYHSFEEVGTNACLAELMMMGLRLREGVALENIKQETGQDWRMALSQDKVQHLVDEGFLTAGETHIQPTMAGMQRLNSLLAYLL